MTDNSGVVKAFGLPVIAPWHGILAAGLSVFTAASFVVVVHTEDPASADTVVTSTRNAVIRLVDGSETEAVQGAHLPQGAQLRTGQDGGAELSTAGRNVYVGALSTVDVLDGVRQKLARGQVMVDSRKGPRLELTTLAGTVTSSAGALARVETAAALRLAVFEGVAGITATGRQARTSVVALHQVQVPYGFLPGAVTPLALTDDRWESRLASNLVSADLDLSHLATNLGGSDGAALLNAAPASLRTGTPSGDQGERALSVALAQTATGAGSVTQALTAVESARSDGGSWGVVAALVESRVTAVSALLDQALTPAAGTTPPTVEAVPPVTDLPGLLTPSVTPTTAGPTSKPTARPTRPVVVPTTVPVTATPTPTPPPTLVGGLLDTVLGLLKPPAKPAAPATSPSPLLGLDLGLGH